MIEPGVSLRFDEELWFLLPPRHRRPSVRVQHDGTSTIGHLVEALGVPLTEVGALVTGGCPVAASCRPDHGDVIGIRAVTRPQPLPVTPPRFILDVHLGTLARRLRLVGLDSAYSNDAGDDELIVSANEQNRLLLTQDRGLLRRRSLRLAGYVRGARPDQQFGDVLERFAPPLAPWTICPACNGRLAAVAKADVAQVLPAGTRRTYQSFACCLACGHVYWRGAHSKRLEGIVAGATAAVARGRDQGGR
jgi:uncharacterized protein with PIN domain